MNHLWHRAVRARRLLSSAIAVLYITTAIGVPLPFKRHTAKSGEQFPCSSSACGCATAEQCWRSCCCHSLAERIAWARKHGVRPPDHAIASARAAGLDLAWLEGKSPLNCPHCVVQNPSPSCCQSKPTCCQSGRNERSRSPSAPDRVVAWRALACHGHSLNWFAAAPTLIPTPPEFSHALRPLAWLNPLASDKSAFVALCPDVPPPERA